MSYKVELSDHFKKESKRLIKKYRSLKNELAILFDELSRHPKRVHQLATKSIKSVWLLLPKAKENVAEQA